MARRRTSIGTYGTVSVVGQIQIDGRWVSAPRSANGEWSSGRPTRWRARTKFRDEDGRLRDVERFADTKALARTILIAALRDRVLPVASGRDLRADMAVADAADIWLQQVDRKDSGLAASTRTQYRGTVERYVRHSSIAWRTLREANSAPVLRRFLQTVADERGTGSAHVARTVVSGILAMAVQDGVLPFNAMREVRPTKANLTAVGIRDTSRALTRGERDHLIAFAEMDDSANRLDLVDLVRFMAGTGVRIGEALSQSWSDVDLEAGTSLIRGTKTASAHRLISLPPWLIESLTTRAELNGQVGLVFPSPGTTDQYKVRDRRNVARALRTLMDGAGFPWATPHTLRRTVASLIDAAGLPIALAADQLGHADPSMTMRRYLGRRGGTAPAAAIL